MNLSLFGPHFKDINTIDKSIDAGTRAIQQNIFTIKRHRRAIHICIKQPVQIISISTQVKRLFSRTQYE